MKQIIPGDIQSVQANMDAESIIQKEINNRDDFGSYDWEPNDEITPVIGEIIKDTIDCCWGNFFGFRGKVDNTDLILSLDTSDIISGTGSAEIDLQKFLPKLRGISFTPHNGYITIDMVIKDVFIK